MQEVIQKLETSFFPGISYPSQVIFPLTISAFPLTAFFHLDSPYFHPILVFLDLLSIYSKYYLKSWDD